MVYSSTKEPCSPVKRMMWIPLILLVPICSVGFFETYRAFRSRQELFSSLNESDNNNNMYYPSPYDMITVAIATTVIMLLRSLSVKHVFLAVGDWALPLKKDKWSPQTRADKVERFASCAFKFLYFVFITSTGYLVLREENFLPPQLGGTGDLLNAYKGYPFHPASASIRLYYLVQLSYHMHSLLVHLWTGRERSDFVEMALHHFCAIFLVGFSYYNNFIRIGAIVLFVHDIADIVGYAVKCSVDTSNTALTLSIYLTLLASWGYTRLYVFPFYVLHAIMVSGKALIPNEHMQRLGYWCFEWMLSILQLLHIYWYVLFILMGVAFLTTGKTEDIQHRVGREEDWTEDKTPGASLSMDKNNKTLSHNGNNGAHKIKPH